MSNLVLPTLHYLPDPIVPALTAHDVAKAKSALPTNVKLVSFFVLLDTSMSMPGGTNVIGSPSNHPITWLGITPPASTGHDYGSVYYYTLLQAGEYDLLAILAQGKFNNVYITAFPLSGATITCPVIAANMCKNVAPLAAGSPGSKLKVEHGTCILCASVPVGLGAPMGGNSCPQRAAAGGFN